MKNAVFWDIRTQFIPHRRHIFRQAITGLVPTDYRRALLSPLLHATGNNLGNLLNSLV
jgi:hypothetical protein